MCRSHQIGGMRRLHPQQYVPSVALVMVAPELRNVGVELLEGGAEYPGDRGRIWSGGRHGQGEDGVEQGIAAAPPAEVEDHEGQHRAGADGAERHRLAPVAGALHEGGRRDARPVLGAAQPTAGAIVQVGDDVARQGRPLSPAEARRWGRPRQARRHL